MIKTILFSVTLFSAPVFASGEFDFFQAPPIINGERVSKSDPVALSTVFIRDKFAGGCSGSLIGQNYVVTAAHCLPILTMGTNPFVQFGVDNAVTKKVVAFRAHENYHESKDNQEVWDIALLRLESNAPEGTQTADILPESEALQVGETAVLAGYGQTTEKDHASTGVLYKTKITVVDPKFTAISVLLDQSHGTGACYGDSGGPAFREVGNKLLLWGIASRSQIRDPGHNCDHTVSYVNINIFRQWLEKTAEDLKTSNN